MDIISTEIKELTIFFEKNTNMFPNENISKIVVSWLSALTQQSIEERSVTTFSYYIGILNTVMNLSRSIYYELMYKACLEQQQQSVCDRLRDIVNSINFEGTGIDDNGIKNACADIKPGPIGDQVQRCYDAWNELYRRISSKITRLSKALNEYAGKTWLTKRMTYVQMTNDMFYGRAVRDALAIAEDSQKGSFMMLNDLAVTNGRFFEEIFSCAESAKFQISQLQMDSQKFSSLLEARIRDVQASFARASTESREDVLSILKAAGETQQEAQHRQLNFMNAEMKRIQDEAVASLRKEILAIREEQKKGVSIEQLNDRILRLNMDTERLLESQKSVLIRDMESASQKLRTELNESELRNQLERLAEQIALGSSKESLEELKLQVDQLPSTVQSELLQEIRRKADKSELDLLKTSCSTMQGMVAQFHATIDERISEFSTEFLGKFDTLSAKVDQEVESLSKQQAELSQQLKTITMPPSELKQELAMIENNTVSPFESAEFTAMQQKLELLVKKFESDGDYTRFRIAALERTKTQLLYALGALFVFVICNLLLPLPAGERVRFS